MLVGSLVLAAAAAGCNAFSSVMQRRANRGDQARGRFGPGLVAHVVAQPAWLVGFLAMVASFLLQATALSTGTLAAVEPVLVLELPLTLILAAWLLRHRMHRWDWISAAAMALGLAVFIAALAPAAGRTAQVPGRLAGLATAATVGWVAIAAAVARYGPDRSRAALFGVAAGSGFGLTASLIKIAVSRLSRDGIAAMFTTWETYGFVVCGAASVVLVQAALHAGTLVAAQPGITLLDPVVSVLWGTLLLHETIRTGPILALAGLGCALIVTAVVVLARSSASTDEHRNDPQPADSHG